MALLLLGPRAAVIVAVAGVWTQCTVNVRQRYPLYRTVFSIAAEVVTMAATGLAYQALGGTTGPFEMATLVRPLVGAIATYFCLNTGLVALAIALSTGRSAWAVWRDEFLWSAASFMVAGSAGAIAAVVIQRGQQWEAVLMLAPVYLTYRTYHLFVGRLEDQRAPPGGPRCRVEGNAGRARRGRGGQRPEGSVPGHRLARAAHAAERHPRLGGHALLRGSFRRSGGPPHATRSSTTRSGRRGSSRSCST